MSENQQKTSDLITTQLESPEPWKRVLKVEIDRSLFDTEYNGRLKKAAKSHTKPGFRKGRTPKAVVEKEMGQMIRMDSIEALIPKAWMAGVIEHKLSPITDPNLENMEFEDEGPLKFDLTVEVRPEVEASDYEGFAVKKREVVVEDKEVDEVLERLRESKAQFEVQEKEASEGDQITLDLTPGDDNGEMDAEKTIADQQLVLGAESNLPAFNEALTGVKAGDERTVEVVYPEDHPNDQLKGKNISFHCAIKSVAVKEVPELNDELAASLEEGKTLEGLKEEILENLTKEATKRVEQELDQQVQAELVRRNTVSVPPSMISRYLDSGLEEMKKRNQQIGRESTEEEEKEYLEMGKPHAEKALAAMLLMEALQEKEDIKVTDEDVDERIEEVATENGFPVDQYKEYVNSGDEKDRMKYDILERRTYDFLLSRAEIEAVPADTDVLPEQE